MRNCGHIIIILNALIFLSLSGVILYIGISAALNLRGLHFTRPYQIGVSLLLLLGAVLLVSGAGGLILLFHKLRFPQYWFIAFLAISSIVLLAPWILLLFRGRDIISGISLELDKMVEKYYDYYAVLDSIYQTFECCGGHDCACLLDVPLPRSCCPPSVPNCTSKSKFPDCCPVVVAQYLRKYSVVAVVGGGFALLVELAGLTSLGIILSMKNREIY